LHVDETENPDLFWGLRGGGGNFGVVTEFEFRLHPVAARAHVVELFFPVEEAAPALRGWRDLSAIAPRAATFTAWVGESRLPFLAPQWHDRPMAAIGFVWAGEGELDPRLLPALRALGRPAGERVEELDYLALQRMDDTLEGHALRRYWKGHYLRSLSDEAIDAFLLRGMYVNAMSDEGASGVARAYPPTKLARLKALKVVLDPDNVFHLNQNISPD
jgi:FAD/FMN-containing dehydrogenase